METQLIHANLDILYDILGDMTKIQAKAHGDVSFFTHAVTEILFRCSKSLVLTVYLRIIQLTVDKLHV